MDIHRCRFVPIPPSSINALAFSHSNISSNKKTAPLRLAVGRANGDIEIWNPIKGSWLQEIIIRGGKDRSIDGLVWTQDPNEEIDGKTIIGKLRLFSIGYTTTITEWDLSTGKPLRQASGNHGEIWCIAAQPSSNPANDILTQNIDGQEKCQYLITGCTDGALVLYSTQDENLQLHKVLVRPSSKKAKVISVVFQTPNVIVAGCTDSAIRIFDLKKNTLVRTMTLGSGPKGGPKDIIVWSIKSLKDGTIISGDSTGELKIWDGKTYTLRQRLSAHKEDVLCLATNPDGTIIFSGGMDKRTVLYKPSPNRKGRWIETGHRRFHIHDVKAMASFEGLGMSMLVSGGHDASPIVVPMSKFGFENHRALPFLSQDPTVRSASKVRLIVSWWDREVRIWKIKESSASNSAEGDDTAKGRQLVAKLYLKGEANITSASLSPEGSVLIVTTSTETKAFHLQLRVNNLTEAFQISKIEIPPKLIGGARLVNFSPDGKWLCIIRPDSSISLARLIPSASSPSFASYITPLTRLNRQIDKFSLLGGLGNYDRTIIQATFSANSRILAVSDLAGYIDCFVLSGDEDQLEQPHPLEDNTPLDQELGSDSEEEDNELQKSKSLFGQSWIRNPKTAALPKLSTTPVIISFRPSIKPNSTKTMSTPKSKNSLRQSLHDGVSNEDRLLAITATGNVYEFEVLKGSLSQWSRNNPPATFPEQYRKTLEVVRGVVWDLSAGRERVWLYSISWVWMFDLGRDFSKGGQESTLKRKRGGTGAGGETEKSKVDIGMGKTLTRVIHEEVNEEIEIFGHDAMEVDEDDDAEADSRLPHPEAASNMPDGTNENGTIFAESETQSYIPSATDVVVSEKVAPSYHTFKYRPIVYMAEIDEKQGAAGPEVVLVERPIWETELPPRYCDEQEWRSREIDV
ncbi:U3 snoRNP/WD40 family protein [Blumeria hordei DH14]|uniref:U3 snoRNP/WD40 family protein n=1 Tax=Blumeria graminis f. sp. hordei (strain DH14) TaxID=546991 RepID=N1J4U7_BLUG1|nr:U3 snoRNP/WD40 family protein [Blumeria hordei DH14]